MRSGSPVPSVKVVDEDGNEKPVAEFDAEGRLVNAADCVGEIVNTGGVGPFEGYYNNPDANEKTTRFGWYWSGDLGYLDADHYLYFAGRNADWIRVDGENFPAGPIEETLRDHPDVVLAAVYGVPDDQAGDQAMAGLVLRDGATFDPAGFAAWIDAQADIGPKWRPRYVRRDGRAADHGHVQDRQAHARPREVARATASAATRCSSGAATSRRTARSRRPTRTRCTRRS